MPLSRFGNRGWAKRPRVVEQVRVMLLVQTTSDQATVTISEKSTQTVSPSRFYARDNQGSFSAHGLAGFGSWRMVLRVITVFSSSLHGSSNMVEGRGSLGRRG